MGVNRHVKMIPSVVVQLSSPEFPIHAAPPMAHTKGFRSLGLNAISPRFIWKMVGPPGRRTWDQVELTWYRFDYLLIIQKSTQ